MSQDPHPDCYGINRSVYDCFCGVLTRDQRVDCLGAWIRRREAAHSIATWQALPWWRRWLEWLKG